MSDLTPDAQAIVDAARGGDDPSNADRERVRSAVFANIAAGGALTAVTASSEKALAGTTAGSAGASAAGLKIVVALVVAGAVGAGGYILATSGGDDGDDKKPAPALVKSDPEPQPEPEPEPQPEPQPQPQPEAQPEPQPELEAKPATPVKKVKTKRRVRKSPKTISPADMKKAMMLLGEANRSLRSGDGTGALRNLADMRRQYPGMLGAERAATRVLALCKLGRASRAKVEATRFLKRWSKHPWASRVRGSCGAK